MPIARQNINSVDLSSHDTVFCDSLQALEWAFDHGLPESAIIKSSAPAVLWGKNKNIINVEGRWTADELEKFQRTIQKLTEDIFDASLDIIGIERELALTISKSVWQFQKVIYKAACLDDDDFTDPRLLIYVDGKTGPAGNIMNSPWGQILSPNSLLSTVNYTLKNDKWNVLTTQGISYWRRFKISGYETIIYRLAIKIMKRLPDCIFSKELLMPNENELNIEIASSLAIRGVKISKIQLKPLPVTEDIILDENIVAIYQKISPIIHERVKEWVPSSAIKITMLLFKSHLEKQFEQFKQLTNEWDKVIKKNYTIKQSVLANSPGGIKGYALSYICRKNNIPLVASQHGVTIEISKVHSMNHIGFDNSVSDIVFSYNRKIVNIEKNTYFDKSIHHVVGMPLRLIRMNSKKTTSGLALPIVYISTNLYYMGFGLSSETDYIRAKNEQKLVTKVLSKLPHKVCYKTYPEDNRRYADSDPVLSSVKSANNIELFSKKIDMRYLISEYRILVTTCATSTLGWAVMSNKPVVFIDQKRSQPLTDEAHASLSEGLFVFDDDDENFHINIRNFLSQSIETIEELWQKKEYARKEMIKDYFSKYKSGAGKKAARIMIKEYFV